MNKSPFKYFNYVPTGHRNFDKQEKLISNFF